MSFAAATWSVMSVDRFSGDHRLDTFSPLPPPPSSLATAAARQRAKATAESKR
jgi:hypothetical protein